MYITRQSLSYIMNEHFYYVNKNIAKPNTQLRLGTINSQKTKLYQYPAILPSWVNKGFITWKREKRGAWWCHISHSGSQSKRRVPFNLPSHETGHITDGITPNLPSRMLILLVNCEKVSGFTRKYKRHVWRDSYINIIPVNFNYFLIHIVLANWTSSLNEPLGMLFLKGKKPKCESLYANLTLPSAN